LLLHSEIRARPELRIVAIHGSVTYELLLCTFSCRTASNPTMSTTATISAQSSGTFFLGGKTPVHRLGFGAMRLTGEGIWGEPKDRAEAKRVLQRAVELDVNFIDTADSYGPDVSEEIIAEALHPYPKGLVIATKAGFARTGPGVWLPLGRPEYLHQQVEMSLRRLKVERIDLWQLHRIDPKVPVEESLAPIKKLQEQGKILHVGLSEVKPHEIDQARKVIEIVSVQNQYNLSNRQHEDVVDYCTKHNLGFIPWFPVASGKLARAGGPLDAAAKKHGATTAQLSLAWLLHRSPVMLPIPGTSSVKHLEENIAAASLKLDPSEWQAIEADAKQK
jgi:aryl-alcohol dehydrogenase-like predicted oxidoreductase